MLALALLLSPSASAQQPEVYRPLPVRPPAAYPSDHMQPTPQAVQPGPAVQPATQVPQAANPQIALSPALVAGPARRANVRYTAGLLSIHADNSSLNGILREVARLTGMRITGGVVEERVYGDYGPADPASVLSKLLNGTASNMLLKQDANAPVELVLTPRTGGASPPSPQAQGSDEGEDLPPQQIVPVQRANGYPSPPPVQAQPPGQMPTQVPAQQPPGTITPGGIPPQEPTQNPADASAPTTDVRSPNGVKTPQEIYDQLVKLQQQKSASPPK